MRPDGNRAAAPSGRDAVEPVLPVLQALTKVGIHECPFGVAG